MEKTRHSGIPTVQAGVIVASVLYTILLAIGCVLKDKTPLLAIAAIPFALLGGYLTIFHLQKLVFILFLILPLSINFLDVGFGLGISVPAEVMLGGIAVVSTFHILSKNLIPKEILSHPISILILLQVLWFTITLMTSSHVLISLKFFTIRVSFMVVFFIFVALLARETQNILKLLGLYMLGAVPVIVYAISRHASKGFAQMWSFNIPYPFYMDHTIYGACLAMILPFLWVVWRNAEIFDFTPRKKRLIFTGVLVLVGAIISSYSRATWLSLIVTVGASLFFMLKVRFRTILVLFGIGILVGVSFGPEIYEKAMSQKHERKSGILDHASSVTNLRSDDSNLERLNRWSCAWRMFEDRPLLGFGPGTYEVNYSAYQTTSTSTSISTRDGDMGDAHSEFLIALSETGLPGLIILVLLIFTVLGCGMRVIYHGKTPQVRVLALGLLLGLITYYVHGFVNSFLDTDKTAALFWGMTAMITALDAFYVDRKQQMI